nr:retrovirus-related Pol polyprotein from transposon TNT 1-94 [Tanacetum cinerariifolium]
MGLWYSKDTGMSLTAYTNADHAGYQDTRRTTLGSAQFLSDKLVGWSSKKQKSTAIWSTEAKYIALSGERFNFLIEKLGATPPKIARKFKKTSPSKKELNLNLVYVDEEPKYYEEVHKKSLRDFHKTHPSGSGTVTKIAPSAAKNKPSVTNEGTGVKPGVPDVIKEESSKRGNKEEVKDDKEEKEDEYVRTLFYYSPTDEDKTNVDDNAEGDKDEEMDYTTSQLYADVDIRLNEPIHTDEGLVQKEDIPTIEAKIVSPMDVPVHHEVPSANKSSQPQSLYEAAASLTEFELKKILIDKMEKSESYLAAPEHTECYDGLIKSYEIDKTLFSTYDKVYSLKRSRKDKDKDKYEEPSAGSDRGLKKRKITKDAKPTKGPKAKESKSDSSKGTQSLSKSFGKWLMKLASSAGKQSKTFDELMSTPIDFSAYIMNGLNITNLTQETLLGPVFKLFKCTHTNYAELAYDFEECYKALSEKLDWENPKGGDYSFDLTKPIALVKIRNRQKVPVDYFFNNDLNDLEGGILSISHWRDQRKNFYGYAQGLESTHDVYSTKRILVVTQVKVMRKHRYRYMREIEVQRADNDLYTFKEGDLPRLHINDIEDMLILIVQNRLTNLLGDDVSNFAIALRMFTRSMVIQKRVEDLQLGVESYQKKINVTKLETTRPGIRKKLMRLDELYKSSDGTLTRLQTSLDDIIKNIRMEYLPQRRWSTLEKKQANIMIKAIDKQLKKIRIMRSLKKFVGERHYRTDLRLLQRTT